ncbi:Tubulin-tyrosine ligase family protein [Trichomonas vaginalis G3]|uniref:Tubulin-tyrosine ligase family protein n=1 Tax=Trichomonas vaginalis (strain ATCC PRA-98 / G3) TaxID=412133 RepID=A2EH57_TRIV3|nr:protein polyglutamylation [Trichomonas vaginalis G3]EAY08025.1 Tubulin-tyrosine ligase family protein [Trichomonas vaginalis G3]KAI5537350.1 protein polyglutamylation [Trichomonas vaginalis G3]|eukprot:XP_001320248.1 Tubulin-tyrosine ligase family protein [Trichomonas vaginalis G3]
MIPEVRYIVFKAAIYEDELDSPIRVARASKLRVGSYNKQLVQSLCYYNGLKITEKDDYVLYWGSSPDSDKISPYCCFQKINHFPNSKNTIGNKAEFAKIIQTHPLIAKFPNLFPKSYIYPEDNKNLYQRMKSHPSMQFISKPPRGSGGNGIKIITFKDYYSIKQGSVVSDYIARPLLIDGFKFDLRIYVLVTSFCPLRAFVYKDGLARFATETYTKGKDCLFAALTNATLNKKGYNYCDEFKWKLTELVAELEKRWGRSPSETMKDIYTVVAKTLTSIQSTMTTTDADGIHDNYFEIYGFDILIDREFHMWLLEVNTFPCLGTTEESDYEVKGPMIANALSIVGIPDLSLSELRSIEAKIDPSQIDLDQLQAQKVKAEDERNRQSGNGFVRIFPSELTAPLEEYLLKPLGCTLSRLSQQIISNNAQQIGESLTGSQGMVILMHVLTKIEAMMRRVSDPRLLARIQCFLVAQGYTTPRGTSNTRALLRHYIDKLNNWISVSTEDFVVQPDTRKRILSLEDADLADVLESSQMKLVKNVRLLFP